MLLTDTVFRKGKEGFRDLFLEEMTRGMRTKAAEAEQGQGKGQGQGQVAFRVISREVVDVRMAAPELDSNTGSSHPVEFAVLG